LFLGYLFVVAYNHAFGKNSKIEVWRENNIMLSFLMTPTTKVSPSKPVYSLSSIMEKMDTKDNILAFGKQINALTGEERGSKGDLGVKLLTFLVEREMITSGTQQDTFPEVTQAPFEEALKKSEAKFHDMLNSKLDSFKSEIVQQVKAEWYQEKALLEGRIVELETRLSIVVNEQETAMAQFKAPQNVERHVPGKRETFENVENAMQEAKDRKNRKCNLIFYKVPEKENESEGQTVKIISEILQRKMRLGPDGDDMFLAAKRLGKASNYASTAGSQSKGNQQNTGNLYRPILIECGSEEDKVSILRARKNLGGSYISIDEDLTKMQREKVKSELIPAMLKARAEGNWATIRGDKLVIRPFQAQDQKGSKGQGRKAKPVRVA
jgi:hypothetical protein